MSLAYRAQEMLRHPATPHSRTATRVDFILTRHEQAARVHGRRLRAAIVISRRLPCDARSWRCSPCSRVSPELALGAARSPSRGRRVGNASISNRISTSMWCTCSRWYEGEHAHLGTAGIRSRGGAQGLPARAHREAGCDAYRAPRRRGEGGGPLRAARPPRTSYPKAQQEAIDRAAAVINDANTPVILAGNGDTRRHPSAPTVDVLRTFCNARRYPATWTYMAKGVIDPRVRSRSGRSACSAAAPISRT